MFMLPVRLGVCFLTLATGCATTSVGQVREVAPGIYSVGVSNTYGVSDKTKALNAAVEKAGEYCHAKGQKLSITPSPGRGNDITFRCATES